jgi:myo-inositol-1(or 4)-monophosphatase
VENIVKIGECAVREAGALLLENFGKSYSIEKKADQSLVTEIDKKAESIVASHIRSTFPHHRIIGEETGSNIESDEYLWVIDPIDGTHNFIRGMKHFGVSLGIIRGSEFVAGIIFLPAENKMYVAEKGSGTFCNGKRCTVSNVMQTSDATLLFDSGFRVKDEQKIEIFRTIAPKMFNVRMFGASVINLTYVAEGIGDVLIECDDNLWDYAAGITIVAEAGGLVTDFRGNPLTMSSRSYVASNGLLNSHILKMLNEIEKTSGAYIGF